MIDLAIAKGLSFPMMGDVEYLKWWL
jgi:hypothetical protein